MENKKIDLDGELALITLRASWKHYLQIEQNEENPDLRREFRVARRTLENSIKTICGVLHLDCGFIDDHRILIEGIDY